MATKEPRPTDLTDDQRVAAVLMLLFAAIAFDGRRMGEEADGDSWFEWTVEHYCKIQLSIKHALEADVWWAMRHRRDSPIDAQETAEDWLDYVNHVRAYHTKTRGGC